MLEALAIFIPFLLTGLLLPWWHRLSKRIYITPPGKKGPMGGGWLIAGLVALLLFVLTFVPSQHLPVYLTPSVLAQFALLSLLAIVLGSLFQKFDKTGDMPGKIRRAMPFVFVGIGAFFLPEFHPEMHFYTERALYVLIWLVIMRAFFMADRLDGLAVVSAAIICLGLSVLVKPVAVPALIVAGCCLGFLRFNRPDALILLGVSGRHWLGFIVGGLWLMAATAGVGSGQIFALLVLLVPLLLNNFATRTPWHARLEALGLTPGQVLARFIGWQAAYLILAVPAFVAPAPLWFLGAGIIIFLGYIAYIKWLERGF